MIFCGDDHINPIKFTHKKSTGEEGSIYNQVTFLLPLAATSILMMVTHSLFNAGITRLPSPEVYLAAFAVAKSLMHVLECPVMMIRQTVTALVDDQDSLHKVRRVLSYLIAFIVVIIGLLALSNIGRWIFARLMGLSGETLDAAVVIIRVLILFPIAAAIRNYYHGIAIKLRMNPLVTVATTIRIIFVLCMVLFIHQFSFLDPGIIAGMMFIGAVFFEAGTMFVGIKISVGSIPRALEMVRNTDDNKPVIILNNRIIFNFLLPLIITALIKTNVAPVVNAGLARTVTPEITISAYNVAWSLGMIIVSPIFMFHQVVIQYLGSEEQFCTRQVKKFSIGLALTISAIMGLIAFTGIGNYILGDLIGTNQEITLLAMDVLKVMTALPIVLTGTEFYFGMLVKAHKTKHVGIGKAIQMAALIISMIGLSFINLSNPALVGAISIIFADGVECIYLYWLTSKSKY